MPTNVIPASATKLKQARAEATRVTLISAARKIFSENGYHDTGITDIVDAAAITRGGLYYHFAEKRDLFEAVVRQIYEERFQEIVDFVAPITDDIWKHFTVALERKLELTASDLEIQKLILIDAPAVLGWKRWREIQFELTGHVTAAELEAMMNQGVIKKFNPSAAAHLVLTALNEASLMIAHDPAPNRALKQASDVLFAMLDGLRR